MMKAYCVTAERQGEVREIPVPVPKDDEVVIEIKAAGLCGTDGHIFHNEYFSSFPLVPGHEFSGVVASMGKNVKGFSKGQRVTADPNIACGHCSYCQESMENFCENFQAVGVTRNGAFAQFTTVPQQNVFSIGDLPFEEAAYIEPLACVVYGQERARPPVGGNVLIVGAGAIGLLHLQLARVNGAATVAVMDVSDSALAEAKTMGADLCLKNDGPGQERLRQAYPHGFHMVIDCTGVPRVVEGLVPWVRSGGTLLLFGVCPNDSQIAINPYEVFKRDLTILGSFALRKTFPEAIALLKSGKIQVDALTARNLELDDLPEAIAAFAAGVLPGKSMVVF